MSTKTDVLKELEAHRDTYISGEALAERLGITRAAVWKAVRALKDDGFVIDGVNRRGYRLSEACDILSQEGIEKYLHGEALSYDVNVKAVTGSTNADVKAAAQSGAPDGYVMIAAQQTGGAGRRGRSFYSPADTGVYISILLRPEGFSPKDAMRITTIAAVAACRAIEEVFTDTTMPSDEASHTVDSGPAREGASAVQGADRGLNHCRPGIKWVNDVFLHGRKVCGILTEASFSAETGQLDYAVMGIGFNVYEPKEGFPEAIRDIAGPVFSGKQADARNRLTGAFLNHFPAVYTELKEGTYIGEYRERSLVIGREIRVLSAADYGIPGAGRSAVAEGIDEECGLIVRYEDGTRETLSAGEISIKGNF